jgi:tRNA nucleotidyltransferase/poly(A) polymerase
MMTHVDKLDVPEPLSLLGEAFREAGHELYLVGGYVRDRMLLDEASREQGCDADATTGAHPGRSNASSGRAPSSCGPSGSASGR